ncbi:MAG TPA: hypothetical protein VJ505_04710 [Holophagaceae bacterium]|nr:hypothetical protein [Holophagaceae bacterium]
MRRSSKVVAVLLAGGFLAALAWALATQSDLWRTHARPLPPRPQPLAEGEAPPPEPSATGVYGTQDEDSNKALEKHLKAQRDARKRLDAPVENRK